MKRRRIKTWRRKTKEEVEEGDEVVKEEERWRMEAGEGVKGVQEEKHSQLKRKMLRMAIMKTLMCLK